MSLSYRIKDFWYDLRYRIQRFKRGYGNRDVWDIDQWFIRTIKPMLIQLRDEGNGIPGKLYLTDGDNAGILWENILTEMIGCLDMMEEDNVYKFLGFGELEDYKRMTIDDVKHVNGIMENNKNRFFELFSEYFYYIWD